jgi:4-hydroxybenzoate polyprenyltransferase
MQTPAILPTTTSTTTAKPYARGMARRLAYLTGASLWARVLRGEGALLAINTVLVIFAQPPARIATIQIVLSAVLMAALYAINDWRDAEDDRNNPKKNQQLVEELIELRRPFFAWLCVLQIGVVAMAFALLGSHAAIAATAMIGINFSYSWWLKGVPFVDVVIVCAWGASFAAIVTPPWSLCLAVGLMTGIMHVFQIQEDRDVDAANQVMTTVVGSERAASGVIALLCAVLYLALLDPLGPAWAASAFIPLMLQRVCADTPTAWMASRIYCGVAVLAVLESMHEVG